MNTRKWNVGRYTCEGTIGRDDRGIAHMTIEWCPREPEHLTERELAEYRRGRDKLVRLFAAQAGLDGSVAVIEQ